MAIAPISATGQEKCPEFEVFLLHNVYWVYNVMTFDVIKIPKAD